MSRTTFKEWVGGGGERVPETGSARETGRTRKVLETVQPRKNGDYLKLTVKGSLREGLMR